MFLLSGKHKHKGKCNAPSLTGSGFGQNTLMCLPTGSPNTELARGSPKRNKRVSGDSSIFCVSFTCTRFLSRNVSPGAADPDPFLPISSHSVSSTTSPATAYGAASIALIAIPFPPRVSVSSVIVRGDCACCVRAACCVASLQPARGSQVRPTTELLVFCRSRDSSTGSPRAVDAVAIAHHAAITQEVICQGPSVWRVGNSRISLRHDSQSFATGERGSRAFLAFIKLVIPRSKDEAAPHSVLLEGRDSARQYSNVPELMGTGLPMPFPGNEGTKERDPARPPPYKFAPRRCVPDLRLSAIVWPTRQRQGGRLEFECHRTQRLLRVGR